MKFSFQGNGQTAVKRYSLQSGTGAQGRHAANVLNRGTSAIIRKIYKIRALYSQKRLYGALFIFCVFVLRFRRIVKHNIQQCV